MEKTDVRKCFQIDKKQMSMKNGKFHLPCFGKDCSTIKPSRRMIKKLVKMKIEIDHECDFVCQKGQYWILIPIKLNIQNNYPTHLSKGIKYCGIDPGIIKIATTFSNEKSHEYFHNRELLNRLNTKIWFLKNRRKRLSLEQRKLSEPFHWDSIKSRDKKRIRKKYLNRLEKKKIDYVDNLHWSLIKSLLDDNDVVFFGDIKSHSIVKDGKNKKLNQEFNDLKFHQLKTRLVYKGKQRGKQVVLVNEAYTSQGCSNCGNCICISDRIYSCKLCKMDVDRDMNSAKNILMKGIIMLDEENYVAPVA
jgi:putative transposase